MGATHSWQIRRPCTGLLVLSVARHTRAAEWARMARAFNEKPRTAVSPPGFVYISGALN